MATSEAIRAFRWLSRSSGAILSRPETVTRCLAKPLSRSMATEAASSTEYLTREPSMLETISGTLTGWNPTPVTATAYSFPSMEPVRLVEYSRDHLYMPLRKDILHRAVIYEGDKARQGTASTKWRDDVHGSGRKLAPQKGTGRARVGDRKSPIRKGGGVAHGPHPRDFSSKLPNKLYDQAWRIALSYRYRRGQMIIVDNEIALPEEATPYFFREFFLANRWGQKFGRSTLITSSKDEALYAAVKEVGHHATILNRDDVDVKNLLETARLIIEKRTLDQLLAKHSRDLVTQPAKARY